jgi:predicted kinase
MTQRPAVYMLCGLPFAGKSTLGRALARRCGWLYLELDQINIERGVGVNGGPISRQQWTESYREAYRRLKRALADGHTVVYDATNFRRIQRDQVRRFAAQHNAEVMVIHVQVPEDQIRRRRQSNRITKQRLDVRDEDFAEVAANFQQPTDDERVLHYDQRVTLEEWLAQHFPIAGQE